MRSTLGLIALDRRDLTVGATPGDSLCSPFDIGDTNDEVPANCMGWETDIHTTWFDYGQFFTTDLNFFKNLDFTLGGRLDEYKVNSVNTPASWTSTIWARRPTTRRSACRRPSRPIRRA